MGGFLAGSQVHQPKTGLSRVPRLSAPLKKAAEATFFNAFGALTIPAADYYIGGYRIYIQAYPQIISNETIDFLYNIWVDKRKQLNDYLSTVLEKEEAVE